MIKKTSLSLSLNIFLNSISILQNIISSKLNFFLTFWSSSNGTALLVSHVLCFKILGVERFIHLELCPKVIWFLNNSQFYNYNKLKHRMDDHPFKLKTYIKCYGLGICVLKDNLFILSPTFIFIFLLAPQIENVQLSQKISVSNPPALIFCLKCMKVDNKGKIIKYHQILKW